MASFEQHVNIAVVVTGIAIVPLNSSGLLDINQSLIVLFLGLIGGILPDLDSDNSKPIQISFKILSIFLPLLVLLSLSQNMSLIYMLSIWLISTIFLHFVVFKIFLNLTVHRGIFHTIPMGLLFGEITIFIFYSIFNYELIFSTIAGLFIIFGFLIHLLLDEIISLNLLGIGVKKSFGTALKLYDKNNIIGTFIVYLLVILIPFLIEIDKQVFVHILEIFNKIKIL